MSIWKEITHLDTLQYSDSTEISPDKNFCINCCYQLEESSKSRKGSVLLIKFDNNSAHIVGNLSDIDGILDCCWVTSNNFILASSLGALYFCSCDNSVIEIEKIFSINDNSLCLSVDYYSDKIISSNSLGALTILDSNHQLLMQQTAHQFECWVCHLSRHDENLYYSGGDDCKFKGFDLRCSDNGKLFEKKFDMGCTSIQSHPIDDNIVSTGSYDGELRVWDLRQMKAPMRSFGTNGGIWRHKWCPIGRPLVLVAGMHAGFSAIRTDGNTHDYMIRLQQTDCHTDGLAYGADWVTVDGDNNYLVAASSFYDHRWSLSALFL